jgi:hypothetical protein
VIYVLVELNASSVPTFFVSEIYFVVACSGKTEPTDFSPPQAVEFYTVDETSCWNTKIHMQGKFCHYGHIVLE